MDRNNLSGIATAPVQGGGGVAPRVGGAGRGPVGRPGPPGVGLTRLNTPVYSQLEAGELGVTAVAGAGVALGAGAGSSGGVVASSSAGRAFGSSAAPGSGAAVSLSTGSSAGSAASVSTFALGWPGAGLAPGSASGPAAGLSASAGAGAAFGQASDAGAGLAASAGAGSSPAGAADRASGVSASVGSGASAGSAADRGSGASVSAGGGVSAGCPWALGSNFGVVAAAGVASGSSWSAAVRQLGAAGAGLAPGSAAALPLLPATSVYGSLPPLLARWPFDGTALDASGHSNTLSPVSGRPSYVPGLFGWSLTGQSTGMRRNLMSAAPATAGPWSLSVWYYSPSGVAVGDVIWADSDGFTSGIGWGPGPEYVHGYAQVEWSGVAQLNAGSSAITSGVWHLAVLVLDGAGTLLLYVDGSLVGTADASGLTAATLSGSLTVYAASGQQVDEVAVWDSALSPGDVSTLWGARLGRVYPPSSFGLVFNVSAGSAGGSAASSAPAAASVYASAGRSFGSGSAAGPGGVCVPATAFAAAGSWLSAGGNVFATPPFVPPFVVDGDLAPVFTVTGDLAARSLVSGDLAPVFTVSGRWPPLTA